MNVKNGKNVFFNVNRHINPTNICINRCAFCAFYRTSNDDGAYALTTKEISQRAVEAEANGATEVHIVGRTASGLDIRILRRNAFHPATSRPRRAYQSIHGG